MTQADRVYSTPPTNTPITDDPIAIAIVFMMNSGGAAASLLAQSLEARLAHRCAVAQKAVLR
jgi:hypothetical protein